jgi:hypothetical protein
MFSMNRFQRRQAAAKRRTKIAKKLPFGRCVLGGTFDEDTDKVTLVHTTRGSKQRTLSPHLMAQLLA